LKLKAQELEEQDNGLESLKKENGTLKIRNGLRKENGEEQENGLESLSGRLEEEERTLERS
jgi:hypothetical protein